MKRPAFQFYPGDWLHDIGVRACSLAARGLWMDMLSFMHQANPYGHLLLPSVGEDGGKDILKPILPAILARMVGSTSEEVERLLAELEQAEVFSRTAEGVIFSRRMVQDEKVREARAIGGAGSLRNPNVPRPKATRKDTLPGSFGGSSGISLGGSPSSSSSSSSNKPSSSEPKSGSDGKGSPSKNPKKAKKHAAFKALLQNCYEHLNPGEEMPWDGSDAKQLDLVAKSVPTLDEDKFHKWLLNYAASENINPADRPRVFLPRINSYGNGPLDKFGRPKAGRAMSVGKVVGSALENERRVLEEAGVLTQ